MLRSSFEIRSFGLPFGLPVRLLSTTKRTDRKAAFGEIISRMSERIDRIFLSEGTVFTVWPYQKSVNEKPLANNLLDRWPIVWKSSLSFDAYSTRAVPVGAEPKWPPNAFVPVSQPRFHEATFVRIYVPIARYPSVIASGFTADIYYPTFYACRSLRQAGFYTVINARFIISFLSPLISLTHAPFCRNKTSLRFETYSMIILSLR